MALPKFQSDNRDLQLLQSGWAQVLDPVLTNPSLKNLILKDIVLTTGANIINHRLGRTQQGWRIIDINGVATIYRSAAFNDLTLTLTASAGVTISLEVF